VESRSDDTRRARPPPIRSDMSNIDYARTDKAVVGAPDGKICKAPLSDHG
jgi:hypothetical protein